MSRNGKRRPPRPQIEVRQASATPEEAAAIAAAIEQFLRDTAPPARRSGPRPWARTGMFEAAGVRGGAGAAWGDPEPWGR